MKFFYFMVKFPKYIYVCGVGCTVGYYNYFTNYDSKLMQCGHLTNQSTKFIFPNLKLLTARAEETAENYEKIKYDIQMMHSREREKLQKEIRDLKRKVLLSQREKKKEKSLKKSLIEMYGEIVDELETFKAVNEYEVEDELPRVVVVGEQSAGKTSVLELIVGARLFPRGSGSMKTRTPIKITLAEGPYRFAQFDNTSENGHFAGNKFDIEKPEAIDQLREAIETRMSRLAEGKTVSKAPVSLTVHGPGLKRMVLVDLPGIINTVTTGMHSDAKSCVKEMVTEYMCNPNAIILCIQDASKDAETSSIVDLVSSMDFNGKRTIFVLTKLDRAVKQMEDPTRIHKILEGKVFKMKALGYYAVIAGTANPNASLSEVKKHEQDFFSNCELFRNKPLPQDKITTDKLTTAISEKFWKLVKESIEHQCDIFKALRFNLETKWKHKFKGKREKDRYELFETARRDMLDYLHVFLSSDTKEWESSINKKLWSHLEDFIFNNILLPAENESFLDRKAYQVSVDIKLSKWVSSSLPADTVKIGRNVFVERVGESSHTNSNQPEDQELFKVFKDQIYQSAFANYHWDPKGENLLRIIQKNALDNAVIDNKENWNLAVNFLIKSLRNQIRKVTEQLDQLQGPGLFTSWFYWQSKTDTQRKRRAVMNELYSLLASNQLSSNNGDGVTIPAALPADEVTAIRRQLQLKNISVDAIFIRETWSLMYRLNFLKRSLARAQQVSGGYYEYKQSLQVASSNQTDLFQDVVLFWRLYYMLTVSIDLLIKQIAENESRRFENILNNEFHRVFIDDNMLRELFSGERVQLAEDLRNIRTIQEKLEEFKDALKMADHF